jgi:hypothetical protein
MFRRLRNLLGFGAQKKFNRTHNRFFKNVKVNFDQLEDRVTPVSSLAVSPGAMQGWAFDVRDLNGDLGNNPNAGGGFVTGPATPPSGTAPRNCGIPVTTGCC